MHLSESVCLRSLVQWDADGIQRKKPELTAFLRDNKVDVICIQETHLTKPRKLFVRGYESFRHDRTSGPKGGVLTLVRHTIPAVWMAESVDEEPEFITIKLLLQQEELLITNCYSSPASRLNLHKIQLATENHIIAGDFNGHLPAWGYNNTDSRGEDIQDWMIDNELVLINKPKTGHHNTPSPHLYPHRRPGGHHRVL